MAFDLKNAGGYGNGTDEFSSDNVNAFNSYAQVTSISQNVVVMSTEQYHAGNYQTFSTGDEILFHVSAMKSGNDTTCLGKYFVATITNLSEDSTNHIKTLTISKNPLDLFESSDFDSYHCQLVTIPSFTDIILEPTDTIKPFAFNASSFIGGILIFKVAEDLIFNGGHIQLTDTGIPTTQKSIRPTLTQEESGKGLTDVSLYAGWENWTTHDRLILNVGDGIACIIAKNITGNADSRIGNINSYGVQFCRGASDSVGGKPSNTTNIGGSTILIACDDFNSFDPKMISKYRAANSAGGQGLARAYIASKNTRLRNDEGLYAFDIVSDSSRVVSDLNIKSFGDGSLGNVTNLTQQMNNYAKITAISSDGFKLTYTGKTAIGAAPITPGSLVMIHSAQSVKNTTDETAEHVGKFKLAYVLSDNGTTITIDKSVSDIINPSLYACQIISIPQFQSFTLTGNHTATPKWNNSTGGVFAICVKGTCNLSGGKINVELKGGGSSYGKPGLATIGNAQDCDRLPIGQGHGSVFIIANKIQMDNNTRIGATYSGALFSGAGAQRGGNYGAVKTSGYRGANYETTGGSGAGGGNGNRPGGYGSNGYGSAGYINSGWYGSQGAHIFILADSIEGFNIAAISTGGQGGRPFVGYGNREGEYFVDAGAGYGGGGNDNGWGASSGGYNGGGGGGAGGDPLTGGGSSGWCFIYCNNATFSNRAGLEI